MKYFVSEADCFRRRGKTGAEPDSENIVIQLKAGW